MLGNSHRALAAASWVAAASQVGLPGWQVAAGIGPAVAFSAGPTSPDADQSGWWRLLDKLLPDELLGEGGPLGHRQFSHFWGIPALMAFALYVTGGPWYAWAAVVGWAGHLAGDLLVGRAGYGTRRGIPLGPWFWHVGLGLRCGGPGEMVLTPLLVVVLAWWAVGLPVDMASGVGAVESGDSPVRPMKNV